MRGPRDYGLLGQIFLNNFHIEIDNQKCADAIPEIADSGGVFLWPQR
jgi:hypothetical protein